MRSLHIAFAGDRQIAVQVLQFLLSQGVALKALILPVAHAATHAGELRELCAQLQARHVFVGDATTEPEVLKELHQLQIDYLISVHYPTLFPSALLGTARIAALNLLPAFLPYSRCWHKAAWAMLDNTPYGATLYAMTTRPDAGDIIHQRELPIRPEDTAHTAYSRAVELELTVFKEAWPGLCTNTFQRTPQDERRATRHGSMDIHSPSVQALELNSTMITSKVLDRLRALTTSRTDEAAYFTQNGRRYRVQVHITPEQSAPFYEH